MKQILRVISKSLLVLTLVALAALLVFGLVLLMGWPWWVGFFILVGIVGLVLAVVVVRKALLRRREQMFVHQIIAQDESIRQHMTPGEQDGAKELQARWTEAIEALRRSHLRKQGNPLYVLPWYMVIGESGSGKTTAIESARLSTAFAEVSRTSGISGTRNCDWWFFEQAILIDTAGRYAVPVDQGRDKDEWQKFLTLLSRFRKKEPLNGLVVTVAADHLAQAQPEALLEEGRTIRRRIEELTRVLGAQAPVYILVTKCDLIQGATQFCDHLPEAALNQAMGVVNAQIQLGRSHGQKAGMDARSFTEKVFQTVGNRLRELRLLLLHKTRDRSEASSLLLFPAELEKLQESLTAFMAGAFQENPYQETPLLRGVFFSSGRQEGTPFSHFLNALGLIQSREVLKGTNKGLFLHDFFAKILPADRYLFKPTQHIHEWRKLTRNLGLTAWIAIIVSFCGLLSYVFVKNLNALSDVRREFQRPAQLQGDLINDVVAMDRFRKAVERVEEQNRNWWIFRLGLTESIKVEAGLKQKYILLFQNGFLNKFDKAMGDRMALFRPDTPSPMFGAHVAHLVRRINLLKARLADERPERLAALPQPVYGLEVMDRGGLVPEMQQSITTQYLTTLSWETDGQRLDQELIDLQNRLKYLLTLPGGSLNWLVDWVNADDTLEAVHRVDFWGGDPTQEQAMVPAAFTRQGRSKIDAAVAEIEAALLDPLVITGPKTDFAKWYHQAYLTSWHDFARDFPQGIQTLHGRDQWQAVVKQLPTDQGPFFALLSRMADECRNLDPQLGLPAWVDLALEWQTVATAGKTMDAMGSADLQKSGLFQKAARTVAGKLKKAERAVGVDLRPPKSAETQLSAAKAYAAYRKGLEALAQAAESRNVAFQMAADLYQQDPATGESPFFIVHRSAQVLKEAMGDQRVEPESVFWALLDHNVRLMQHYVVQEAACSLQDRWEKEVLVEIQDLSRDKDVAELTLGGEGYVTQFLKGPAAPFVARGLGKGYYTKKVMDMSLPIEKSLFTYLGKGSQVARPVQSSHSVKISAQPTNANPEAQFQPHSTVLEMQCATETTRLENLNYPVSKTFDWSPTSCGDVVFQIFVGDLVLSKSYTGDHAFAQFLNEFKSGQRMFQRSEFPSQEAALKRLGIQYINAKYQFQGQKAVLALLNTAAPSRPPRDIVACWD